MTIASEHDKDSKLDQEESDYMEDLELTQQGLDGPDLTLHHLILNTAQTHQSLKELSKVIPFIGYAVEVIMLGYQLYTDLSDKFSSKQKKALTVGSSILQAGLLAATTGLAIAALTTATAAVAVAGAAVYTGFCAVRAIRYIVKAIDCIRRNQDPAHHLMRKEKKLESVQKKISLLREQLKKIRKTKKISRN